ncbi:MAG: 50S ribosomal protein L9 [Candidatus Parcubacteria bacterium]|nr:50S ribosomal protein L9 [Candidatus Parcubacteria bacterium]
MKVVLIQDVEKLGKKYELKEVADGFARNFLIPKKLAKLATDEVIKRAEAEKEANLKIVEDDLGKQQEVASRLDGQEINIAVKAGDDKQVFGSVTVQKIAEKLKESGFEIKKDQIILNKPIKEIGEFPIKVRFGHNLEAEIKIIVTEESEK